MTTAAITAAGALSDAVGRLAEAGVPEPARDARRLLAHALGVPAARLALCLPEPLDAAPRDAFARLVAARARRVPVSHLVGLRSFWGRDFRVTADVLDPRPETETLIAAALEAPFSRVLDLGTGSGCILLTLLAERGDATGLGSDISEAALAVASDNAARFGLSGRAAFRRGSWTAALGEGDGRFDLIVSNPPYISAAEYETLAPEPRNHEPRAALTDDADGLGAYRVIARDAPRHLERGGRLMVEIGPQQGGDVRDLLGDAGLSDVRILPDFDGRDRVVTASAGGNMT